MQYILYMKIQLLGKETPKIFLKYVDHNINSIYDIVAYLCRSKFVLFKKCLLSTGKFNFKLYDSNFAIQL